MSDINNEILYGTPDMSPEEEEQLKLEAAQEAQQMQSLETFAQQQIDQAAAQPEAQQESPQQSAQPTGSEQQQGGFDIGGKVRQTLEGAFAVQTSLLDFGVNMINLLPSKEVEGIDNPFRPNGKAQKLPKFQNDAFQAIRELTSVVAPTIWYSTVGGKLFGGVAGAAASTNRLKFLADPLVKKIGSTALGAGIGTGVEAINLSGVPDKEVGDNLTGLLKKNLPAQFGWIPDNIATLDSDLPDGKRAKHLYEGTVAGLFTDALFGLGKLIHGRLGIRRATRWVPESEKAQKWFAKNMPTENVDDIDEAIAESTAKRSDALDELGEYNLSKSVDLDTPVFGVHDLYGYEEMGIRSVDDLGIVGAAVDAVRTTKNIDSVYGRVGSVISEAALKYGLEIPEGTDVIIRGLAAQLKEAGEYGYKSASGRYISHKEIIDVGEELAMDFYKMDTPQLRQALKSWQGMDVDTGAPVLKSEAYAGVFKTINKLMEDYADMDVMRAQAYVGTSFAGQVSDMAQGMRLMDGSVAVERAQEQILDRLEFLMAQKGMTSYARGRALNALNLWKRVQASPNDKATAAWAKRTASDLTSTEAEILTAKNKIKQEVKQTIDTLREVKDQRPELLKPLMMAYELTDGNVNTITKLNNYVRNSTGILSKALFDGQPEIASAVMRGFYANLYNSTLSAIGTPIKAGVSNIALLAERPISMAAGAIINRDTAQLRKGWFMYSSLWDTLNKSFSYMNQVYKRSATDPFVMSLREDMGVADEKQLEILAKFADAKAQAGEFGPQVMMSVVEEQNALANHPWLRFGQRGMQAFDGFTQAFIANVEARGRVWDQLTLSGKQGLDSKTANDLAQNVYKEMFDENDNITDSAVRYAAGEISMSLDNPANDALSGLIRRAPILKPFLLFTKTPLNMATYAGSHTPVGEFIRKVDSFSLPFEKMNGQDVERLLSARGIQVTPETVRSVYETERAIMRGRKAIGATAIMGAVGLFMNDNITGDGLYDKEKQRLRRDANWQKRSIRVPGGNWVSYDGIPGVSDWLALTVNIMDNFTSLNSAELAENLRIAGFVLSATITDKSMLAALEPLNDVVSGDVGAINRWTSSFATSAAIPGSSLLGEFGRLITANKKELENNFFDLVANRNPIMKQTLPDAYDWIDGGKVGEPVNFFARVWNTYMPFKVNGNISPEKQFLIDIEYESRPTLKTNGRGVDYSNEERSEVMSIMGQQGLFKAEIQRIMQTTDGKEFRKAFKDARNRGLAPEVDKFDSIHLMLDSALRSSMRFAEAYVSTRDKIQAKQYQNQTVENFLQIGDIDGAEKFLDNMKQTMSY